MMVDKETDRLPKPNVPPIAGSLATLPVSSGRKRSGLKAEGFGYISGSCNILLYENKYIDVVDGCNEAYQEFAITVLLAGIL